MKKTALISVGLLSAAMSSACGSDTTAPDALTGAYYASQWVTTGTSGQTNQLTAGSSLNIFLGADHTTTGQLHVAASGGNQAFDADMAGTWSRSGNTITFSQTADTFVRNTPFTVVPNSQSWDLAADHVFSGTRIQLTLSPRPQL